MRDFGLKLDPNRSACACYAWVKTSVRRAARKNHDVRPWDDRVGRAHLRGVGASREPGLSLFETRTATRRDFAPCDSWSFAGNSRFSNLRFHAAHGSGKAGHFKTPAVRSI